MKSTFALTIVVACLPVAGVAHATPSFWYVPQTGGIYMKNDTGEALAGFAIISAGNNLTTDSTRFAHIAGAVTDPGDLPYAFTYLLFPPTQTFWGVSIGNVVKPGTPASDISGVFFRSFVNPVHEKAINGGLLPEPASGTLTTIAAIAFVGLVRRSRR